MARIKDGPDMILAVDRRRNAPIHMTNKISVLFKKEVWSISDPFNAL